VSYLPPKQPGLYADPPVEWVGWRRARGGPWQRVSRGRSEAEAWQGLYAAMEAGPKRGGFDSVVLREGERVRGREVWRVAGPSGKTF
jgi:hypothetical protein